MPCRALWPMLLGIGLMSLGGCAASRDVTSFASTQGQPMAIAVIDATDGRTLWAMDVPIGQRLELKVTRDENARGSKLLTSSGAPATAMRWSLYEMYGENTDEPTRRNTIDLPGHPIKINATLHEAGERPRATLGQPQQPASPATQPEGGEQEAGENAEPGDQQTPPNQGTGQAPDQQPATQPQMDRQPEGTMDQGPDEPTDQGAEQPTDQQPGEPEGAGGTGGDS